MSARAVVRLVLVLLALPSLLGAQEAPELAAPPPLTSYDMARYQAAERRDPFVPLIGVATPASGPRFEQLRLTGVFLGAPGSSLVVLEDPASRGHFLRVGDEVGNARLLDILPDGAVFEVRDYGSVRREILHLDRDARRVASPPAPALQVSPQVQGSPQVQALPPPSASPPVQGETP